ncbi:high mobility group box domain-containing protein [Halteromyces radiatus]|uniref:high mobility group box domain-containing protein n=1 Tax=Halteromyces radiatus TaxID=101107 RepID=UPI00221F7A00|nr:high mobility group box domain-containing protein [Halteromyces radiatus]KAI8086711.1 high mobility group box domain-containing protein [Halteromyces radiatus]
MDNLADNLHFNLSYPDFTQHVIHQQDPSFQNLPTTYSTFSLLQTNISPPELHPSSVDKDTTTRKQQLLSSTSLLPSRNLTRTRVTRPPNAFLLFNKEMRKRLKIDNPTWTVSDISKEIGDRWRTLSQEDKHQYVVQANKIKESQQALHPNAMYIRRSKAELTKAGHYEKVEKKKADTREQQFAQVMAAAAAAVSTSSSSSSSPTIRKQKRDKNPGAPKHPLSAYMWYLTEVRPETRQSYPGSTVGQISKLCADRWNTMTESERLPWMNKATADKARYAREMRVYASQNNHPMGRGTRQKYRSTSPSLFLMTNDKLQQQEQHYHQHSHLHHGLFYSSSSSSNGLVSACSSPTPTSSHMHFESSSILRNSLPGNIPMQDTMNPNELLQTPLSSSLHDTDTY